LAKISEDDPENDHHDLKKERLICNINNTSLDTAIKQTTKNEMNNYKIPELPLILENIKSNIKEIKIIPLCFFLSRMISFDSSRTKTQNICHPKSIGIFNLTKMYKKTKDFLNLSIVVILFF
jgi:hypothetical protein